MSKNYLKNEYYSKANNLCERLLGKEPEDEEIEDVDSETTDDAPIDDEQGQSEQVDIYFGNLDEETQKVLLDALKQNLNVAEDDDYANEKIIEILAKDPLVSFRAEELVRKLNITI